jgi:hypothetical protein
MPARLCRALKFAQPGTVDSIKHRAVRPRARLQKTHFDQTHNGLLDFRQPGFDALLEYPPLRDPFQRILRSRVIEQVLKNLAGR